ncbi:DUF4365 domain-containing protein [Streptomyces sp. Je 1-4]|uniref:DUF4365 domain-containing protein n=1 Tax=Streptomyces TaxID=1883 RepID=UPI002180A333|nr:MULTISPECIES: DUF4365 domain-containing protein [unclassified Streptomyces]UYB40269.1 DUF4365 domain-containing protein [Streptomyces sp. Je 1-4]UZQ36369.1 DUF4365 domain-containing protein [Streptomyces sp. Je 1-4] [Streptomyces sp. Je 1-4 4N24]UZQ43787.1 DUF4365 domain-containing protein [Streptomyces sp. Je 1-4] [Streptomyces sp. Je 1-4 4N24_ara]
MMHRKPSAKVASIGVTQTQLAVEVGLGWLFREQPTEDYGIDAHVEVVDAELVRGRLLALQIKSGSSWFSEQGPGGWWFRPDAEHVQYWINHSLPVAVVLYHPEEECCYWQLVNRETLIETRRGSWKLLVPEAQVLDKSARAALSQAAEGDPYTLRIRELQLARPWMRMLVEGMRLVIDIEEWVNKTSGRGAIALGVDNEDGNDPEQLVSWNVFLGLSSYVEVVPKMFAWANVGQHAETYDNADYSDYPYDRDDWGALHPYMNPSGEVDFYRLELTLNELGRAFLLVDQFASEGPRQLTA